MRPESKRQDFGKNIRIWTASVAQFNRIILRTKSIAPQQLT
jgi:hypothetical protein